MIGLLIAAIVGGFLGWLATTILHKVNEHEQQLYKGYDNDNQ